MFKQNQQVDKVNMSLDELIKFNKQQNKQTKKPMNNNNNNPRQSFQKKKQNGQNQQKNNGQSLRQGNNRQRQFNNNRRFQNKTETKKPFGILNRSRSIKKNKSQQFVQLKAHVPKNQQQKRVAPMLKRKPVQAQFIANRRRLPNNNRMKRANNNQQQRNLNRLNNNNNNNKAKNSNTNQLNSITIIKPAAKNENKSPQKAKQIFRGPAGDGLKSRIKMQSARKNVQKAKRLLIAKKKPTKQLMTQRYASKLGLAASSKTGLVRQRSRINKPAIQKLQQPKKVSSIKENKSKMLTISIANKKNKIMKAKAAQKKQLMAKKAVLTKSRPQGLTGTTSSRMVFF